jgi:hypothetical protein
MRAQGHTVRLVAPEYARPYVKAQKNDDRDAEGIAEAATRPPIRFVELKSEAQLDLQMLPRARDRLVGERTGLISQLRGIFLERGIVFPQGRRKLAQHLAELLLGDVPCLSQRTRVLIEDMRVQWRALDTRIEAFDAEFVVRAREDNDARRLATIPGIDFIEYEAWFNDPAANLAKLRDFLDLPSHPTEEDVDLAIGEIVMRELRHDDLQFGDARQPLVRSVYQLLRQADRDPSARDQVENIASQFLSFQQLQRGIQQGYEDTAALADRFPSFEREITALRNDVHDHETALAAADARAEIAEARLAEMLAEADEQRGQLDKLERDRDGREVALEATSAELAAAHNVIAEREAALEAASTQMAAAHTVISEREAALVAANPHAVTLEARLVGTLAEAEEQCGRLEEVKRDRAAARPRWKRRAPDWQPRTP